MFEYDFKGNNGDNDDDDDDDVSDDVKDDDADNDVIMMIINMVMMIIINNSIESGKIVLIGTSIFSTCFYLPSGLRDSTKNFVPLCSSTCR